METKKNYIHLQIIFILIIFAVFVGCSKDDNPVTNTGSVSQNQTLLVEQSGVDSVWFNVIMIPKTFNGDYDLRNSDSIIVTFKANTIQVSNNDLLKVIIWGDSSFVNFLDLQISCNWLTGNYDYRYAVTAPKRKLDRIQYFLTCNTSTSFLAVRNLKIWKK